MAKARLARVLNRRTTISRVQQRRLFVHARVVVVDARVIARRSVQVIPLISRLNGDDEI